MPKPWIAVQADVRSNAKLTELPNDTARYGYFVALGEAKLHGRKGSLTPGQWRELMGRFARYQGAYVDRGLLHIAPDYCQGESRERCLRGRGPFEPGTIVIHDWPEHQREHAVRQASYRHKKRHSGDGDSDPPSDVGSDVGSDISSRALSLSMSDVSPAETESSVPSAFDLVELVERLTSRPFGFSPGSVVWQELEADVAALGAGKVAAAYRAVVADANGEPLDAAGVVYGGHKRLYRIPRAPSAQDSAQAEKDAALARLRRPIGG